MAVDKKAKPKAKSKPKAPKAMTAAGVEAEKLAAASGDDGKDAKVENWADKPDLETYIQAAKLYEKDKKAYDNKQAQIDDCEDFWAIYSAQPSENQQYSGNSQCYIPAVRDAINARVKRSLSQLFPTNHKHVDAVGPTDKDPAPVLALMEHYIRTTRLKSVVRADLISGDVTGQWNLYIDWAKSH